jgi:hypothetical protein
MRFRYAAMKVVNEVKQALSARRIVCGYVCAGA